MSVKPWENKHDDIDHSKGGRGVVAGWIKCPLCAAKSQKRFAAGKGFRSHLECIHPRADHASVIAEASNQVTGVGETRNGRRAQEYTKSLPRSCTLAREGEVDDLRTLSIEQLCELDCHASSCLDWAAGGGHVDCVEFLLDTDVDWMELAQQSRRKRHGKNAVHWACRSSHLATLKLLLDRRKEWLHAPANDGTLPFHSACYNGNRSVLEFLQPLVDWTESNNWQCTAEHFASLKPNPQALEFLEQLHGGDEFARRMELKNAEGVTPSDKMKRRMDCE